MDLISLTQAGIHVVATSVRSDEDRCNMLKRYAHQVVLLFDGDAAILPPPCVASSSYCGPRHAVSLPLSTTPTPSSAYNLRTTEAPNRLSRSSTYLEQPAQRHDLSTSRGDPRSA